MVAEGEGKLLRPRLPVIVVILFLLVLILPFFVSLYAHAEGATIWTDKDDYNPEETVTIFGSGFLANNQVTITVTAPDSNVTTIYAMTDESGAFTAYYTLDGLGGTYMVVATDGTNTATTTFTDTSRYYTATISPTTATTGETKSYTIAITNDMTSSSTVVLGSATILVPSGFTIVSSLTVSYPSGKPWTATLVSSYINLNATANSYRLSRGQSVSVTFSATAPGTAGTYTWTTTAWTDISCGHKFTLKGTQPKVTVSTAPTVSITITSSPVTGSGFVKVDDTAYDTPHTFTWTVGGTHTLQALSPVSGGTGIQYVYTSWSDGGDQTHTYTVPSTSQTVTANYKTQYQHTITSSPATGSGYVTVDGSAVTTPYTTPWWDNGSSHTIAANSPVTIVSGQSQYIYSSWSDSGAQSHSISPTTVKTYTANFQLQYYLSVTGGNSPKGAAWYNSGASATASSTWVWNTVTGQSRTALTNWQLDTVNQNPTRSNTGNLTTSSIIMSAYHVVNFVSTTQYYLAVTGGNSITYGTASPTSDNWYDSGQSTTVSSNWVWDIVSGQSRHALTNWQLDAVYQNPTRQYSGTLTTSSITMSTYHTVNFVSTIQYYFSVSSAYDSPTGQAWYDAGSSISSTVTRPVSGGTGIQYETTGWTGTGSLSSGGTAGSSSTGSFTINAYSTCTWNWKAQYYLTMSTNFGTVSPASGWHNEGEVVSISATAPSAGSGEQYVWNGWTGTGTISYTGLTISSSVTMNSPISETASWTHQLLLTVKTSGLPTAYPTKVYLAGSQVGTASDSSSYTKWFDAGTPTGTIGVDNTILGATGTRYVFVKWAEDSSTSNPRTSETMDSPKTFTANYNTQYQITITASPSGALGGTFKVTYTQSGTTYSNVVKTTSWSDWVDGSTSVSVSEPQDTIDVSIGTRLKFDHYDPFSSVTMDAAKTVTLVYKTQYFLTVTSSYGATTGQGWYDSGATAYAGLTSGTFDHGNGTRRVFTQWSGDASGTNYAQSNQIIMTGSKTALASWKTQYLLTVVTDPSGLTPQPTRNPVGEAGPTNGWWYDASTSVTLTAQSVTDCTFNRWDVDGSLKTVGENPISVSMNTLHTATAHYTSVVTYTLAITTTASGATNPAQGTYTYSGGITVDVTATPSAGYRFDHWVLDGSSAGTVNHISVLMDKNHNLQAVFAETHTLTISVSQGGTTNPASGTYTYQTPTDVSVTAIPSGNYQFDHWIYDNNNIGSQNPVTVHVGSSHTLKAVFVEVAPAVGGYSISLAKRAPTSPIAAYTMLIALFGAVLSLIKRKRK